MRNPSDGRSALTDSCPWGRFLIPLVVGCPPSHLGAPVRDG